MIWGARIKSEFEGRVRVMAIMTGVSSPQITGGKNGASIPTPQTIGIQKPRVRTSSGTRSYTSRDVASGGSLIDFFQ